jgi:hypothetical protein
MHTKGERRSLNFSRLKLSQICSTFSVRFDVKIVDVTRFVLFGICNTVGVDTVKRKLAMSSQFQRFRAPAVRWSYLPNFLSRHRPAHMGSPFICVFWSSFYFVRAYMSVVFIPTQCIYEQVCPGAAAGHRDHCRSSVPMSVVTCRSRRGTEHYTHQPALQIETGRPGRKEGRTECACRART